MIRAYKLPLISLVVFVLDQLTKLYMTNLLEIGESKVVVDNFFNLTLVMNPGAAFGMFAGLPSNIRRILLGIVTVVAMTLVLLLLRKEAKDDMCAKVALYMIVGGAFGNLIDRFRYDAVVDFLDFFVGTYHWPAFNIADSAISVGVFLLVMRFLFNPSKTAS